MNWLRPSLHPVRFYLFLSVLAFFPSLFLGWTYFDTDLIRSYFLFQSYLREGFLSGQMHFWDPYLLGGQPFLADHYAMAFYPLNYPVLLFPIPMGHGLFCALHLFLALGGMHYWLSGLDFSRRACLVGAVTFGLSGFFWLGVVHPLIIAGYAWIPWVLGSLEKLIQSPKPTQAFIAGLFFALLFLTGHFQITLGVLYASAAYLLFRAGSSYRAGARIGLGRMLVLAGLFLFASLPLLLLWIPFHEYQLLSARHDAVLDYRTFNADLSLEFSRLYQFLWPDSPLDPSKQNIVEFERFQANGGYAGIWFPFLAFWAFRGRFRKIVFFAAAVGLAGFLIALGKNFPLHEMVCRWAPGFDQMRAVSRYVFLSSVFVPILAAAGSEGLLSRMEKKKGKVLGSCLLYAVLMGAAGALFFQNHWPQSLALVLGLLGFGAWAGWKRAWGKEVLPIVLAAGLMVSGWITASSRLGPWSNLDFLANRPELAGAQRIAGHSRVFVRDDIPYPVRTLDGPQTLNMAVNAGWEARLKNVRGYNSMSLACVEKLHRIPLGTYSKLMAVRGFLTGKDMGRIEAFERMDLGPVKFYLSRREPAHVFSPGRGFIAPDPETALGILRQGDFDPLEKVVFSGPVPKELAPRGVKMAYEWVKDEPDEQCFDIRMSRPNWAVFSEVNYPGWRAWIDGGEVPIVTADTFLRALYLPEGEHRVEFRFRPGWVPVLGVGTFCWLAGTALFLGFRKNFDAWSFRKDRNKYFGRKTRLLGPSSRG